MNLKSLQIVNVGQKSLIYKNVTVKKISNKKNVLLINVVFFFEVRATCSFWKVSMKMN